MSAETIYVVTDGEFDGPTPGINSMLSFASVAVSADGARHGEFEAVLERIKGSKTDPETDNFWKTVPEAYNAATRNPLPPELIMSRFVDWVRKLPGTAVFVSHPSFLDAPWIDYYLRHFTQERLFDRRPLPLFSGAPLCLASFASGKLSWPLHRCLPTIYPPEWLGNHEHTHRAIDDARGYAHLLVHLMKQHL